jgi:hypothetical protein
MANHIPNIDRLGLAVGRVTAAAMLARAVADYVPAGGDGDKLDCFDAIEMHMLRPAAAELQEAFTQAMDDGLRGAQ